LVEQRTENPCVPGSIPGGTTQKSGDPSKAIFHKKEVSDFPKFKAQHVGAIAQLVEQRTENPCVPGSIPGGTTKRERVTKCSSLFYVEIRHAPTNPYPILPTLVITIPT
jgi:hypothetical protein